MKIVVMGFVCSDIYRNGGETVEQIGGSAGNIAAILGYFGKNVSLWFPGYSDIRGNELEEKLKRRGVSIVRFAITKLKTPYICLEYDEKQKKRDLINTKVCLPSEGQVMRNIKELSECNLLYTDRMSPGIHTAIDAAINQGGWVFYEPNGCRTYDAFAKAAKRAHIVKFSSAKIFNQYIERLKNDTASSEIRIMIVTEGGEGTKICYRNKNKFSDWVKMEKNEEAVVDSTGAGDWLSSCFISLFLQMYPQNVKIMLEEVALRNIVQTATKVAELSCQYQGCHEIFDDEKAVEEIWKMMEQP